MENELINEFAVMTFCNVLFFFFYKSQVNVKLQAEVKIQCKTLFDQHKQLEQDLTEAPLLDCRLI